MKHLRLVHVVGEDAICGSLDAVLRAVGHSVERWSTGADFLNCADRLKPACVLLHLCMPVLDGLEVQARMPAAGLDFPVILLTREGDITIAVQAILAGAVDVLEKPVDRDKLFGSIEAAFEQVADRTSHREQAQKAHTRLAELTMRERDVLDRLACGYPNQTIAYDLGVSSRTVQVYRSNAMVKLQVTNFADALRVAFAAGLGPKPNWGHAHHEGRKPSAA